jgi:hypothetical protein
MVLISFLITLFCQILKLSSENKFIHRQEGTIPSTVPVSGTAPYSTNSTITRPACFYITGIFEKKSGINDLFSWHIWYRTLLYVPTACKKEWQMYVQYV